MRFKVPSSRFQVQGSRFKVLCSRFQVQGSRFRAQRLAFRVPASHPADISVISGDRMVFPVDI